MKPSKRRRVRHICPDCGRVRWLQPSDAVCTTRCQVCHCRRIAPLGFQATAASKGYDFAIRAAAAYRKDHPSSLEQQVEVALGDIPGIHWEREYAVERPERNPYYVDFAVTTARHFLALEVNGDYVHRHDHDWQTLRLDTLFLFFDDVVALTEAEIRAAELLPAHIQRRLFETHH